MQEVCCSLLLPHGSGLSGLEVEGLGGKKRGLYKRFRRKGRQISILTKTPLKKKLRNSLACPARLHHTSSHRRGLTISLRHPIRSEVVIFVKKTRTVMMMK